MATRPKLTPRMQVVDELAGSSPAAAGGWVPSPAQRALGIGAVSTLFAIAGGAKEAIPGTAGSIVALVCLALAGGLGVALGMASAGPRRLQ